VLYFFDSLLHDEDDFPGVDAAGANQFALSTEHTFVDVLCDFIYFAPHEEDIQPADVVEVGKVAGAACGGARPARNTQLVRWLVLPNVHGKPPVVPVEIDLAVFIYSVSPICHNFQQLKTNLNFDTDLQALNTLKLITLTFTFQIMLLKIN
jgi:hypothetical protein